MSINHEMLVVTQEGPVQGTMDGNIFVFKGIPYAAPPIGELRWRSPAPVKHWSHIPKIVSAYGDASLQNWKL
jgi:para-nitrobenzyl esterase